MEKRQKKRQKQKAETAQKGEKLHRKGQKWPEKVKKIAAGKGKNGQRLKSSPCKKSGKGRNGENSKKKMGGGEG